MSGKNLESVTTVGWCEWLALPELELLAIPAKVDTGAETSSLHVRSISRIRKENSNWVRFVTEPVSGIHVSCKAPVEDVREVVSSNGLMEERMVIRTAIRLGLAVDAPEWSIEVTLADRRSMQFPMLLGREALAGRAVVDAGEAFLLGDLDADPDDFYS